MSFLLPLQCPIDNKSFGKLVSFEDKQNAVAPLVVRQTQ